MRQNRLAYQGLSTGRAVPLARDGRVDRRQDARWVVSSNQANTSHANSSVDRPERQFLPRRRSLSIAVACVLALALVLVLVLGGAWIGGATEAGAATPQYQAMAAQLANLTCDDFKWAASRGLIEPVEVHWLLDARLATSPSAQCLPVRFPGERNSDGFIGTSRAYYVMLAEATSGQLTCADIRWNAQYGLVHYDQAGDLLARVAGCQLSEYERLVVLAYGEHHSDPQTPLNPINVDGVLSCSDVNFDLAHGFITPEQAGWLRDVFTSRFIRCGPSTQPPAGAAQPPAGGQLVDYRVARSSGCWNEQEKYAYSDDGTILRCNLNLISANAMRFAWTWDFFN